MKINESVIKQLNNPITNQLDNIDLLFKQHFIDSNSEIIDILKFLSAHSGKKIRPLLLLLSAEMDGNFSEKSLLYAMLIEVLHTASLIHDDIIDLADMRRGRESVNQKFGNKLAVLSGDYLLSHSLTVISMEENHELMKIYSRASEDLCLGEILEQKSKYENSISVEKYLKIIEMKTASLFTAACEIGVITGGGSSTVRNQMKKFGDYFGKVFQLKDDLLDFLGNSDETGKNTGIDINQNILTYPIISILPELNENALNVLDKLIENADNKESFNSLKDFIEEHGGFENTENKIAEFSEKSLQILTSFDDSKTKETLEKVIKFNQERNA